MTKHIKLFDSLYALSFEPKYEEMINLALATKPTLEEFYEFCAAFGVQYDLEYISKYCSRSDIMHDAVFN